MCDYTADFKDDISVRKGDMVYSINVDDSNKDWIFVRPYKAKAIKRNDDVDDGGFIPRDYLLPV